MRLAVAGVAALAAVVLAAPAHADDTTTSVCGAFNLGVPPDQIAGGLQQGDGRYDYWRAWNAHDLADHRRRLR